MRAALWRGCVRFPAGKRCAPAEMRDVMIRPPVAAKRGGGTVSRIDPMNQNVASPADQLRRGAEADAVRFQTLLTLLQQKVALAALSTNDQSDSADVAGLVAPSLQLGPEAQAALSQAGLSQAAPQGGAWLNMALQAYARYAEAPGATAASTASGTSTASGGALAASGTAPGAAATGSPAQRFAELKPHFLQSERETGVPWQVQAAQWALETGWGAATPKDLQTGQESHNLFGVKGEGPGGSVRARTKEFVNGREVETVASFRAYNSPLESIVEHAHLLTTSRYAPARAAGTDVHRWAQMLGPLGYATDPAYGSKLSQIIRENGWDRA